MNTKTSRARHAAAALLFCLSITWGCVVSAQDAQVDPDPPDRAGRLSFVQGDVSLQPAGAQDWANAVVNRPLTTGDKLWTDEGGRAELQVGSATVHVGSNTGFSFLNVDDNTVQMRMTAGVVNLRVRSLDSNDQVEIDTPNLALSLLRPGNYRVEVNEAGDTTVVKVSEGEAEVTGGAQGVIVHAQQAMTFRGTDQLVANTGTLGAPDAFDSWSLERNRREVTAQSSPTAQYVSPEVTGYEDLDGNGQWSSDPEYGNVWTPTAVAVDWAPYRYGRWVWVAPWGWTWIDDAPWGFAPFHYGRWAQVRNRWCWVPGPRAVRAVYAPALVGWVGTPDFSVSVSVGGGAGVAWFPLGPREVYVPARRYSPRYVERVNVSNTVIVNKTYITNVYNTRTTNVVYRNRTAGAVTAVSRTTFTSAEPVGRHVVRVDEREITRVRATGGAPRIEPPRQAILGMSDASRRNVRVPPEAVRERQVITKRAPPPSAAHFVRNAGQPSMADRVRQRDATGQNDAARREPARNDNNKGNDNNRGNDRPSAANGQRDDKNGGRGPDVVRDQRPDQAQRGDRGNTANGPGSPAAQAERPPRNDRPPARGERDRQQELDARREQQDQRDQQVQRDSNARRDQQQQAQRGQDAQRDVNARRDQQQRDQQAQRQQQTQREQDAQRDANTRREQQQRDQQAQHDQDSRREQQQREQRDQQVQREQQTQREQQAQRDLSARREQQQRDQRDQHAQREQQTQRAQQAQQTQQQARERQAQQQAQEEQQRQRTASAQRPNPQPDASRGERNDRPNRQQRKPDDDPKQQSDRGDRGRNRP